MRCCGAKRSKRPREWEGKGRACLFVAFVVEIIDSVEAEQRCKEPHVGFRQSVAVQIALLAENAFAPVERLKERVVALLIGRLLGGETARVHAGIDRLLHECVHLVDCAAEILGGEIQRALCKGAGARAVRPGWSRRCAR